MPEYRHPRQTRMSVPPNALLYGVFQLFKNGKAVGSPSQSRNLIRNGPLVRTGVHGGAPRRASVIFSIPATTMSMSAGRLPRLTLQHHIASLDNGSGNCGFNSCGVA